MKKTNTSITIDYDILVAVRSKKDFNMSQFCNDALRKALDIKKRELPEAESKIVDRLTDLKIETQLLEKKKQELEEAREKEMSRYEISRGG